MALLNAAEIAAMRATATESLDGTAVVSTQTYVSDGGGGGSTVWAPSGTLDCRMAPLTEGEDVEGNRLSTESSVIFTFPADTSIDHNAQITYSGGTFAVTGVRERSTEITTRVEARGIE